MSSGIKPRELRLMRNGRDIASAYPLETKLPFSAGEVVTAVGSDEGEFGVVVHTLDVGAKILMRCSGAMTFGAFKSTVSDRTGLRPLRILNCSRDVTSTYADSAAVRPGMLDRVVALRA